MATESARREGEHEFPFSDQDFEQVRRLIYDHAGIALSPAKRSMVYSRLSRRLRERGIDNFQEYLSLLEGGDAGEWEAFTNSLTTNLTAFFREPHHFPLLAEHVAKHCRGRSGLLWCSAASTGEEPYSMAMTLVEQFDSWTPPLKILATDLDTVVLAKAEAGVYADERVEKLSPERVRRFFLRGSGANAGSVRVREELRKLVTFRKLNLLDARWPMRGPFDAIFCRNVMIYFDKPTQLKILEQFAPLLRPDGVLFAGHSESFQNATHLFRLRGKTTYELAQARKKAA